ncbi:MAG TPA: two-component regulator propeller domain-containing protein [Chitinophagaceae bacterium]
MQKLFLFLAYFFICTNCFAQQYPFVHYSPKDGLISNQVRSIYQDSKGRLYFISANGLSVYDGARFINYTTRNGLEYDIVNCVMEMGEDSVWIVTNSNKINCLVDGRIKTVLLKDTVTPIINSLSRDEKGVLYAATDQGLYFLDNGRFTRLPFIDLQGRDVNTFIANMLPVGDHLLLQRDHSLVMNEKYSLYLYNRKTKKATSEVNGIYTVSAAPDGRIWLSTERNILSVDTAALKKGKFVLQELPGKYDKLKNLEKYFVAFDPEGNCWLGDQNHSLMKADPDGNITPFTAESGLNMFYINRIFQDREGITWIATHNAGLNKLVHSNFSFIQNPFGVPPSFDVSYNANKNRLVLYSPSHATAVLVENDKPVKYKVENSNEVGRLIETPYGLFGVSANNIYKMKIKGNTLSTEKIFSDSTTTGFSGSLVDINGNLVLCGKHNLTSIVNGNIISRANLSFFADHAAIDSKGNIWVATRGGELCMYQPHPDDPYHYLEQKLSFSKELPGISPRSIIIDKNDHIWIGTRIHGIHVYKLENGKLTQLFHLTATSGLSDNFITQLACDAGNTIWACSPAGLDRITVKNKMPVIENTTKQNNIYQSVLKVIIDKKNTVWALVSNGLIKITAENKQPAEYSPTLMVSMIKAGKDTISDQKATSLSYKQNNLSFYFAATSFLDEKQVLYSYRLQGSSNNLWSEASNNPFVSFIDLPPNDYTLHIKAIFPAGRYPEQVVQYKFSIMPPWWQTWWFRIIGILFISGLLIIGFRFYYQNKLRKQKIVSEKQQAIEKERTRIATDMHDDLGAGLSRIKFMAQALGAKEINNEQIKTALNKITGYSDEMTEKMGEIVWALNEKNDTLADLVAYTRSYAMEYLSTHNIACEANTPLHLPGTFIPGEIRRNIFLAVKECLHNTVKHAHASHVYFSVELNEKIQITIHDNGKGIDWNNRRPYSNGLKNIESRMHEIRGKVDFLNDNGTKVLLSVPLNL